MVNSANKFNSFAPLITILIIYFGYHKQYINNKHEFIIMIFCLSGHAVL